LIEEATEIRRGAHDDRLVSCFVRELQSVHQIQYYASLKKRTNGTEPPVHKILAVFGHRNLDLHLREDLSISEKAGKLDHPLVVVFGARSIQAPRASFRSGKPQFVLKRSNEKKR
jgi:hypothetical protein